MIDLQSEDSKDVVITYNGIQYDRQTLIYAIHAYERHKRVKAKSMRNKRKREREKREALQE